uniref:Protein kinase domain-containing protein n=1 Tax=Davidia involucrata TaxID=16924 RepID=A0A5B7BJ31_DAVIN
MTSEVPGTSGRQFNNDSATVVPSDEFFADKRVHNISVQTGEEFSAEFLRDRVTPRKAPIITDMDQRQPNMVRYNFIQNPQLVYEDLTGLLGITKRDSESGVDLSPTGKGYAADMGSRYHKEIGASGQQPGKFSDEINSDRAASGPTGPPFYVSDSPHSHQPYGYESGVLDGSFSGKMKFLCSFGGRILPRPNDGKLRYAGGETRIISIRKNLTYYELVKKTSAICNQPHTIKYQLPGEDLDALISVSSDEDLHHMIEEYHDLERGSQRLRIFLVSSGEPDSPCSFEARTVQQSDADYQYVVVVNGMLERSPRRSSSGQSLASQWGTTLDNSPTLQRDSPTFHPFDIRDGGSSPKLTLMLSNPAAQFLNTPQTPTKSHNQSPPSSPIPTRHRDPKNSHRQLFEDRTCPDGHENNSPYVRDQLAYGNSYFVDATSYYYNHPPEPVQVMNYYNRNKHLVEPKQTREREVHYHNRSPSRDFLSSPLHGQGEMDFKRSVLNETATRSENLLSPDDSRSPSSGSDVPVHSHHRMPHAFSDSQLQREHGSSSFSSQYPLKFDTEKSPSLAMSSSSQEQIMQQQEMMEKKYHAAKLENQPTFKTPVDSKEYIEWGQDMLKWVNNKDASLGQDGKHYKGNVNIASHANAVEHKIKLPNTHFYPNLIPIVHISPQDLEVPGDMNTTSPASDLENSANSMNQKVTKDQQHVMTGTIGRGETVSHGSPEIQPVARQEMSKQEPIVAIPVNLTPSAIDESGLSYFNLHKIDPPVPESSIQNLRMDASLGTEVALHDEDLTNHSNSIVEKVGPGELSHELSKFGDATFVQSQPSDNHHDSIVLESAVIVEDVTDSMPPDIPSSSTAVPYVQVETIEEISSPRERETENVAPESDYEDAKGDGKDKDTSITDTAIAEMEAGIYGLQIIKNADLEELQELGSGTFGTVYHAKWRGTDVAIKRIKKSCFAGRSSEQERLTKDFWREAQILSKLHHPNVVAFYGVVPDGPGGTMATVTEYMVNGSLRHVLVRKARALDRRKKLMIAMDAAFGMEYLHLKNIVHFDLKCDNLLVNLRDPQRPICKVGDFGLSRIKRNTLVSGGVRGTLPWMAPELLNGSSSRVSEKVDVFSFGVALWEMLTGEEPYANMHCGAIIGGIVNNTLRPPIPERCDPEWRKLMEDCWSPDPAARPSFTQITDRLRVMSMALQPKRNNQAKR